MPAETLSNKSLCRPRPRADTLVVLAGQGLTVGDVVRVARHGAPVRMTADSDILERVAAAHRYIVEAARAGRPVYGVTTGFGGMAGTPISSEDATELQRNLIWFMKSEAGQRIPEEDVRAAMVVRVNTHLMGLSGLRLELVQRMIAFLNAGVTPHVREFGSIGASGDLTPLACITGALIGLDPCFTVDFKGEPTDALDALERLGLPPIRLAPKEGLAMINGTAVMSGMAANCLHDARIVLALCMAAHSFAVQALRGSNQSFHPFIHDHKPHPGQRWAAARMLDLLDGSRMIRDELKTRAAHKEGELIQDRYSLRCLPQYLGPIVEGIGLVDRQVTVEINSATDNPLIDAAGARDYHGGNFLGQYVGVGMDQLRYFLGLLAKHLDAQLSLLTLPEFSNGLPPSLIGNTGRAVNMGLKGLQICGNSIMPMVGFLGNPLVDRYATHAEQFNQNINSLGLGSAVLARQSLDALQQYLAVALIFGVQASDLRTKIIAGHYDARKLLSPASSEIYEAVRQVVGRSPSERRPLIFNDDEQPLAAFIRQIALDIAAEAKIPSAVCGLLDDLT
jgi:phenylalanine ammonia-lyase